MQMNCLFAMNPLFKNTFKNKHILWLASRQASELFRMSYCGGLITSVFILPKLRVQHIVSSEKDLLEGWWDHDGDMTKLCFYKQCYLLLSWMHCTTQYSSAGFIPFSLSSWQNKMLYVFKKVEKMSHNLDRRGRLILLGAVRGRLLCSPDACFKAVNKLLHSQVFKSSIIELWYHIRHSKPITLVWGGGCHNIGWYFWGGEGCNLLHKLFS